VTSPSQTLQASVASAAAAEPPNGTCQFATFAVGDLYFGVEVLRVQEVLKYQPMTKVPLMPGVVRGLINLRGQIVPAIDLRERLALAPRPDDSLPMNVVVRTTGGVVSLLVDEIDDVLEIEAHQQEALPATVTGAARDLITGVYKLKDHLLLALDVERAAVVETEGSRAE
jgi:purine-binding chemotaxis protein CheW